MKLNAILTCLNNHLQTILQDKLVGIYIHGSIAFGCFRYEKSDIDFIVVVKEALSLCEKEAVIQALWQIEAPTKGFEMSVVLEKECRNFTYPTPFDLHYSNAHQKVAKENLGMFVENMHGTDADLAAHFKVIKEVGIVLYGPDINMIFGEVDDAYYLDSITKDIEDAFLGENPTYYILNTCRVMAYQVEQKVVSKVDGAKWALQHLPSIYHILIQMALDDYLKDLKPHYSTSLLSEFFEKYSKS